MKYYIFSAVCADSRISYLSMSLAGRLIPWFRYMQHLCLLSLIVKRVDVVVRTSDPQAREPGFESSRCHFEALQFCLLILASVHTAVHEDLAIDSTWWICEQIVFM